MSPSRVFVSVFSLASVQAVDDEACQEQFSTWLTKHGQRYDSSVEQDDRRAVFCDNLERITQHNAKGDASYTMGLNKFADMTHAEFRDRHLLEPTSRPARSKTPLAWAEVSLPAEVDWRQNGSVTPVKDQGSCGACWSFAATGAMEGAWQRAGNPLVSLSEQQLIDCESSNLGCRGGLPPNCFYYVHKAGGIETEEAYPYEEGKAAEPVCRFTLDKAVAIGFKDYEEPGYGGDEQELQQALATIGPIAISYDAGGDGDFQFYKSGVFTSSSCTTVTDHAMTLVGYGTLNGEAYWLIKNQWSEDWGQGGYLLTKRGSNMCGVAEYSSYPTMESSLV